MTQPYSFTHSQAANTRKRPPQRGFVQTGLSPSTSESSATKKLTT